MNFCLRQRISRCHQLFQKTNCIFSTLFDTETTHSNCSSKKKITEFTVQYLSMVFYMSFPPTITSVTFIYLCIHKPSSRNPSYCLNIYMYFVFLKNHMLLKLFSRLLLFFIKMSLSERLLFWKKSALGVDGNLPFWLSHTNSLNIATGCIEWYIDEIIGLLIEFFELGSNYS